MEGGKPPPTDWSIWVVPPAVGLRSSAAADPLRLGSVPIRPPQSLRDSSPTSRWRLSRNAANRFTLSQNSEPTHRTNVRLLLEEKLSPKVTDEV